MAVSAAAVPHEVELKRKPTWEWPLLCCVAARAGLSHPCISPLAESPSAQGEMAIKPGVTWFRVVEINGLSTDSRRAHV